MKLRVTIDGESRVLDMEQMASEASVIEAGAGTYSVLLGTRSYTAHVTADEVRIGERRFAITVADLRDRPAQAGKQTATGPFEIRAQMPGKVVKLLVAPGSEVEAGRGLIVVEAMKMQNEMKSPRAGRVQRIFTSEGALVAAAQKLMVLE